MVTKVKTRLAKKKTKVKTLLKKAMKLKKAVGIQVKFNQTMITRNSKSKNKN